MDPKRAPTTVDGRIFEAARRHHGVISHAQLERLGLSREAIKSRLRRGRLAPLHRGVYALGPILKPEGFWLAAVLACGLGAVLSHRAAAAHWGLLAAAGRVDVSVPSRNGRACRRGIAIHRPLRLGPDDVTVHDGIPITTVARTLLDLAATSPRRVLDRAVNEAEVLRLFDLFALELAAVGHRGGRKAGAAVERYDPLMGLTRSELEKRFLELCRDAGLSAPLVNYTVVGYKVDFLWPDARRIVETNGWATHGTRRGFERDHTRDLALESAGYGVTRLSYRQVTLERIATARALKKLLRRPPPPEMPPRGLRPRGSDRHPGHPAPGK